MFATTGLKLYYSEGKKALICSLKKKKGSWLFDLGLDDGRQSNVVRRKTNNIFISLFPIANFLHSNGFNPLQIVFLCINSNAGVANAEQLTATHDIRGSGFKPIHSMEYFFVVFLLLSVEFSSQSMISMTTIHY